MPIFSARCQWQQRNGPARHNAGPEVKVHEDLDKTICRAFMHPHSIVKLRDS